MKFSVITVTYQDGAGLIKTLESLSNLKKIAFEHIVIDGGSTDQTKEIINRHSNQIDTWISEPDKGIYDAMNKGLDLVSNQNNIVSFLNAGDVALSNYFDEPNFFFSNNSNLDYCYGGVVLLGKKKENIYMPKLLTKNTDFLQSMPFPHPALFVKKQIFLKVGYFDLTKKITADHEWIVRLIKSGAKGKKMDNCVVKFKLGGQSLKFSAQIEVFKTAIKNKRNLFLGIIFFVRQLIVYFYYFIKSKL